MPNNVQQEIGNYNENEFKILYAGMPDGNDLNHLLDKEDEVVRAPERTKLYFSTSETQALNEYVLSRRIDSDVQPIVLEAWFPEEGDHLNDWAVDTEFATESYPIQNVRGYKDVRTGKFVQHGEGWQPETTTEKIKKLLGLEEEPDYLFDEDTEFDPLMDW